MFYYITCPIVCETLFKIIFQKRQKINEKKRDKGASKINQRSLRQKTGAGNIMQRNLAETDSDSDYPTTTVNFVT